MMKLNLKTFNQKHKTFPANISVYNIKRSNPAEGQENVTLLVNRQNSLRQKQSIGLRCKTSKKSVLLLLIICMCLLIIYANSDLFFRQRILAVFLSSHNNNQNDKNEQNYEKNLKYESSTLTENNHYIYLNYLLNSSFKTDNGLPAKPSNYNIFVIYTKENYHLHIKFDLFAHSLLKHSNAYLHLHIITDKNSETSVVDILQKQIKKFHRSVFYTLYDVNMCSHGIRDISTTLSPYFTSAPNSYYSDSLFFLSLGLHRIADRSLDRAILLDCDIVFRSDVRLLFGEFKHFLPQQLFGLAPELTPVYRHILYRYRIKYPKTNFGNPYYPMFYNKSRGYKTSDTLSRTRLHHGYPGLNSGVVLLQLSRIRVSKLYNEKLSRDEVSRLVTKYSFKGHLGDQDFFTLLGHEYPNLIYRMDCVWNRQLCTWWKDHGYSDIFDAYFHCEGVIRMYHGNCNTRIPE